MIICGPLVRHAHRGELNIWLVLDQAPTQLELTVYTGDDKARRLNTSAETTCLKAGKRCFFYLLRAPLPLEQSTEFSDTQLVYYDVTLDGESFGHPQLREALCLGGDKLPSVPLPQKHGHFIQASCRKPHAAKQAHKPDQLAHALTLLEAHHGQPTRPSQLFLTGDQIYADDVSPLLLGYLRSLQETLGLQDDLFSMPAGGDLLRLRKLDARNWVTRDDYGFSSDAKTSHLLTLSEYLCMYLFAFSGLHTRPALDFPAYDTLKPQLATYPGARLKGEPPPTQYHYTKSDYLEDLENLQAFASLAGSDVRRLLANIPTYMIFDDHEVTDDWNLSKANARQLKGTDVGRFVLRNALTAYFICQHWGNQPTEAAGDLNRVEALVNGEENETDRNWLFTRYWGYELAQTPPVAVLDTRTQREFSQRGKYSLGLMSAHRIQRLGECLAALPATETLLLISPTPMYGFSYIECLQLNFPMFRRTLDREPWSADKASLSALQACCGRVPGIQHVVVFSGDVHYAFARRHTPQNGPTFWQLCSSASNNIPVGDEVGLRLINKLGDSLTNRRVKYLKPEDGGFFLTSDRNIGSLRLDAGGLPAEAFLHCAGDKGGYAHRYNLKDVQET
ncbi:alkaline phosphatase D family protein [Marinobacteraceae bacterium S3BR75-40.1]